MDIVLYGIAKSKLHRYQDMHLSKIKYHPRKWTYLGKNRGEIRTERETESKNSTTIHSPAAVGLCQYDDIRKDYEK